jgi:hypothetical protein
MTHHDRRRRTVVPTSARRAKAHAAALQVAAAAEQAKAELTRRAAMAAARSQHPVAYAEALAGREPAEALPQVLRWQLVQQLHELGLTDQAIALHTRQTLYTAARIRAELGLAPNERPATRILSFPSAGSPPVVQLPTTTRSSA